MAISSPGIGSGLDISGIISKLMQVEQLPLQKMNTQEASYQSKISALGALQGSVSSLNSAIASLVTSADQTAVSKFIAYKASLGDSSIGTATADSAAATGTYSLEVSQLASTHRLSTIARAHTLQTADYANATDPVFNSGDQLTVTVNGAATTITLGDSETSLNGLAAAINNQDTGVTAAIVEDDNGAHMVLTSNTAGTAGKITLADLASFSFDPETETGDLTQTQAAQGGYTSADAVIATLEEGEEKTLELTVGTGTLRQITIDSSNNTLSGLRDAINTANVGVTATLTTVSEHDVRLVLSSNTIGSAGKITLSGIDGFTFNPTTGTGDLSQATADGGQVAQGSKVKINGISYNGNSNTLTDALEGVTLNLSKVTTSATTISISQDKSTALSTAFTSIIKAYNDLNTTIHDLGKYDEKTKKGGPLLGNSTLRTVSSSVKNLLLSVHSGTDNTPYKRLSDLGLNIQKDGSIVFKSSKLTAAVDADYESVAAMAAAFGSAAKTLTDSMLGKKGSITAATDGNQSSIKDINKRRETIANRLTQIEARYRRQFSALDTLMSSMSTTSSYLSQQLANLPGSGS